MMTQLETGKHISLEGISQPVVPFGGLGIGLCGSHRTGKSTIAKTLAERNGLPLVASTASGIAAKLKIDFSKPLSFERRLAFQQLLLDQYEALYHNVGPVSFVSDRTPIDLAAYLLADVPHDLSNAEQILQVRLYLERCFSVTNRYFLSLFCIQPGIPYMAEPGKPIANIAYQEKVAALILGLVMDDRVDKTVQLMPRSMTNREDRMEFITGGVSADFTEVCSSARLLPRA